MQNPPPRRLTLLLACTSFSAILFELILTRIFAVTLFATHAHMAIGLALLGLSIGALICFLFRKSPVPEDILLQTSKVTIYFGLFCLAGVLAAVYFPATREPLSAPESYAERSSIYNALLDPLWYSFLLAVLLIPFSLFGYLTAALFRQWKDFTPRLYAADLIGGGLAAPLFIPLLSLWPAPDLVFLICAVCSVLVVILTLGSSRPFLHWTSCALTSVFIFLLISSAMSESGILRLRHAAGLSEQNIIFQKWTPLTRISIHRDQREKEGDLLLLDNGSASQIPMSKEQVQKLAESGTRSLVYYVKEPTARTAILAAGAGPEISIAQRRGFTNIDAVDVAGEIFDIVAERYSWSPVNPFLKPGIKRIGLDGRSAIQTSDGHYDIIQMVHANLWSISGILADTWLPNLIETKEAFSMYFEKLNRNGMISFARGNETDQLVAPAAAALRERGVENPWNCMAYIAAGGEILIVKKRPWTPKEKERLHQALSRHFEGQYQILIDPGVKPEKKYLELIDSPNYRTDNKPFFDRPLDVLKTVRDIVTFRKLNMRNALVVVYHTLTIQFVFALVVGAVIILLPFLLKTPPNLTNVDWKFPLACAGLGYGYVALEVVFIHQFVLFLGDPAYAISTVLGVLLISSGIGSMLSARIDEKQLGRFISYSLALVVILALITALLLPSLFTHSLSHLPFYLRTLSVILAVVPVGFFMGCPFALIVRALPESSSRIIPWAWAFNGWMSVMGGIFTLVLFRGFGYSAALFAGLIGYGVAFFAMNLNSTRQV